MKDETRSIVDAHEAAADWLDALVNASWGTKVGKTFACLCAFFLGVSSLTGTVVVNVFLVNAFIAPKDGTIAVSAVTGVFVSLWIFGWAILGFFLTFPAIYVLCHRIMERVALSVHSRASSST